MICRDGPLAEASYSGKDRWYLNRLKVSPDRRNQGLGTLLLRKLQETLTAQTGFVYLVVEPGGYDSDPIRLINFYEKNGFKKHQEGFWFWKGPS